MVVGMSVDTTSDFYDSHRRPFLLLTGEGVANHWDGGCDPTELPLTVQPANTARPVETTTPILPQPVDMGGQVSRLGCLTTGGREGFIGYESRRASCSVIRLLPILSRGLLSAGGG